MQAGGDDEVLIDKNPHGSEQVGVAVGLVLKIPEHAGESLRRGFEMNVRIRVQQEVSPLLRNPLTGGKPRLKARVGLAEVKPGGVVEVRGFLRPIKRPGHSLRGEAEAANQTRGVRKLYHSESTIRPRLRLDARSQAWQFSARRLVDFDSEKAARDSGALGDLEGHGRAISGDRSVEVLPRAGKVVGLLKLVDMTGIGCELQGQVVALYGERFELDGLARELHTGVVDWSCDLADLADCVECSRVRKSASEQEI